MEGALATASSLSAGYTSKWPFHLNSKHGDKPLDLRVTHFQTNPILNGGYHIYIYILYIYIFKGFFFVFQPGAAFLAICCILELKSVFCMHFGARISHSRAHLAFGFWLLASLGFTWLCLASLGFT